LNVALLANTTQCGWQSRNPADVTHAGQRVFIAGFVRFSATIVPPQIHADFVE
jgi:hypothetical protein